MSSRSSRPGGDTTRRMGKRQGMESAGYWAVNRNKRGIVLNLKDRRAQDIVRTLARQADVVVENYRPGVMAGFGLDYDSLKQEQPGLIYGLGIRLWLHRARMRTKAALISWLRAWRALCR